MKNIVSQHHKTLCLALLLILFGCVKEEWMPAPNSEQTQEILVSIPSESKGSDDTRATTSAIGNIAVCIFEDNAGVRGVFTNAVVGFNIAEQSPDVYKFTANLGVPKKKVHYVLVANHSKTDAEILALSEEDIPTWDAFNTYFTQAIEFNTAANETVNFPSKLVGQIPAIGHVIREAEAPKVPAVTLIRSVAKINVTSDKLVGYTLSSIHVNKYGTSFHTLYDEAKFNTADKKVTSVNIPTPLALHSNPVNIAGASGKEFSFYVPEFINDKIEHLNRCAVVVGLAKGGKTTYFRLDFAKTITVEPIEIKHLDILRNHEYKFDITNIVADGYLSVDEAFRNRSVNIKYNMIISGDGANDASYDGQNYISVTKSSYVNFNDFRKPELKVFTDAVDGWKVVSKPDWLSLKIGTDEITAGYVGVSGALLEIKPNSTVDPAIALSGEVILQAGRVRKTITYEAKYVVKFTLEAFSELNVAYNSAINLYHYGHLTYGYNPDMPSDYPHTTYPNATITSNHGNVVVSSNSFPPIVRNPIKINIAPGHYNAAITVKWGPFRHIMNMKKRAAPSGNTQYFDFEGGLRDPSIKSALFAKRYPHTCFTGADSGNDNLPNPGSDRATLFLLVVESLYDQVNFWSTLDTNHGTQYKKRWLIGRDKFVYTVGMYYPWHKYSGMKVYGFRNRVIMYVAETRMHALNQTECKNLCNNSGLDIHYYEGGDAVDANFRNLPFEYTGLDNGYKIAWDNSKGQLGAFYLHASGNYFIFRADRPTQKYVCRCTRRIQLPS